MDFGQAAYGLRDVKLTNAAGSTQVDLPAARTLQFTERIKSAELEGDDALVAVVSYSEAVEWSLEAGGISLPAYALMTGRTVTLAGTTPNQSYTMYGQAGECFPWFKIYGRAISDGCTDDIHCKLGKAKLTSIEGSFANGEFWITSCSGIAIEDLTGKIFEFVQHETGEALPAS